jgi:hypothetical protein
MNSRMPFQLHNIFLSLFIFLSSFAQVISHFCDRLLLASCGSALRLRHHTP